MSEWQHVKRLCLLIGHFFTFLFRNISQSFAADSRLTIDRVVPGRTLAASMVAVTLPDGSRIIENVIIEIAGGRVVRQIDMEAWD